ncbi:hypothetical protein PENTCL1PPCAC_2569 [Pristionchus entomophagus]|uniref:Uncharacterized protein n=1 Tax=Pristionchus entomophagus TaxID=358040 RepID=A0AAV5SJW6_9BILA|nr:hypothetical protein PENTCL1PPCAC_2569 [Pristionchus entomophagus]
MEIKDGRGKSVPVAAVDVYCAYNDCNVNDFCPDCEQDDNSTTYRCPDGKSAKVKDAESTYNPKSFTCLKSRWMDDQIKEMQVTAKVECHSDADKAPQTSGSKGLLIGLGIVFAINIIAIILACIICKLQENGWLHAIIPAKIRGDKKKNKKNKKGSSKAYSPSVASGKGSKGNTENEIGTPDQGSSVEPPNSSSGETVEGVSCTGVTGGMSERNTMEGASNEPLAPPQQVIA